MVSWPQHPVGSAYLSNRFPHRRATALSWHTAGGSLGTVAVPVLMSVRVALPRERGRHGPGTVPSPFRTGAGIMARTSS